MPIYKLNGDTYNIPDDVVSSFESDHPEATVRYKTKEGYYNIPVKHRDGFLKKYPDAEVYNGKSSQKEDITQGKVLSDKNPLEQPLHVEFPEFILSANGLGGSWTTKAYTLPETTGNDRETTEIKSEDDRLFEENMQRMKEGKPLNRVTTQNVIDANPDLGLQGSSYQPTEEEIRSYTLRNKPGMFKNRTSSLIDKPLGDAAESVEGYGDKANARVDLLKKYYSGDEFKQRIKKETGARVTDLLEQTDADLNTINEKISAHQKAMRNENWRPGMPSSRDDNTLVELRRQRTLLNNAENILDDSRKIVDEAGKKGSSWYESLGRGVRDKVFDVDSWTMGITDMAGSMNLNKVLEKADREEELDPAEQRLLDAAVTNMAVNAYYSSDLSAAYKAGQVTGESIPFMLEMAVNPISASGNATAKLLLKYGLKKFGQQIGKNVGKTIGAAAGMTATTGVPGVIGGTYDRMNGQVQFALDNKGQLSYAGREGAIGGVEAFGKSAASRFLENHSEMVFNAFKGLGDVVWRGVEKVVPGGVNSFIQKAAETGAGRMLREWGNNELVKEAAKRTQFHGIAGEYLEEVYNNLANVPLGEMTMEQVTDLDRNIDTFLGLAPTSVFFGLLGLGSMSAERIQHRRKMDAAFGNMNEVQRKKLAELERMSKENGNADIRTFIKETMADPGLTKEQKRQEIEYAYDIAVNNAFDEVADEQIKEQGESRVAAQEEGQAVYESGNPAAIRESVVREEVSRGRLEEVYPDVEIIAKLMQADDAGRAEILDEMPEEARDRAVTFLRDYDRHQSVEDAMDEAHAPEVEAAQSRVEEMTLHGRVTVIPLGRFADETHKFGVVVNGLDEAGNTTGNGNFVVVVPIKEGVNGPDFSTFDMGKAEVVSLDPSAQRQEMEPDSVVESMLGAYQADVDKLSQIPIAAGQSYTVLDASGQPKNIQIQGQDVQGDWVVAVEGQKTPSVMPEESLIEMLAEAERASVAAEYAAEEQVKADAKSVAKKEIMSDEFSPEVMALRPEPGEKIEVNGRRASVTELTPDGINVMYLTEGGGTDKTGIISMEDYYAHKQALFDSSQTNQESVQEEQVVAKEKQSEPAVPVKDDGIVDYVSYGSDNTLKLLGEKYGEKMPHKVAVTAEAYKADLAKMQKKLDKAAEDYDNAPIGRESKAEAALQKVRQEYESLRRESDFWSALDAEIKAAQEKPGEAVAEDILSMGEPLNGEEFAAQMLGSGVIKLLRDSFMKGTGFGEKEARGYIGLFASADKGGMSIERAGERLMEADRENGTNFFDQSDANAGRNTIIDVLSSARTRGELANYIKNNRAEQARKEQEAEYAAYEMWVESNFHMSVEEFEAYEEVIARDLSERALSESEYNEFMSIFVDETLNDNLYGQQGIDSESETGGEVLSGAQPLQTERAGRTEKESSEINGNIVGQNGTVSEGASGSELASRIEAARSEVNANPSEAQKEAGNYKMGHVRIDGYDITIENPKGSVRSGVDKGGKSWSITMNNDYGYIRGTEAVDGDHIDVFLSDTPDSGRVFVVDQKNEDGAFDESKVMYGFNSLEEARAAYLSNYEKGWESRIMAITEVSREEFRKWIGSSHRKTKAFSEYKSVKTYGPSIESSNVSRMQDIENRLAEIEDRKIEISDLKRDQSIGRIELSYLLTEEQDLNIEQLELEAEYSGLRAMNDESNAISEAEGSDLRFRKSDEKEEKRRIPLRDRAKDWEKKLGVKVNIMESLDDVTNKDVRRAIQRGAMVTGWFEESTGEVCLFMPYLESEGEIDATYIHEVVAHKGLRGLLGDKFDSFLDKVWESMPEADRAQYLSYPGVNGDSRAAADEYIAHLAENVDVTESAWSKFTELFKKFLKAIGLEPKITDADIANTIKKSYQRLLEGGASEGAAGEVTRFSAKKKRALETASVSRGKHQPTVVSSADGANILNNLDNLAKEYEEKSSQSKTFLGDVANAIGARKQGSGSQYATFEAVNGNVVTIRLADHNATVSNFDNRDENEGISIVVSAKDNNGITNDGDAHIVEYFYDSIDLRRADGKPLAEIVKSIKQSLYSGEYKDTTGLAERQEVNGTRFRFIGERGARNLDKAEEATTRLDNLVVAREMESAEKDAKTIKMATGWERGADGLWRYEVDDNIDFELRRPKKTELKKAYEEANEKYYKLEMRVPTRTPKNATEEEKQRIKELRKELAKLRKAMNKAFDAYYDYSAESTTLGEFLGKDNQLFKEYPELADYDVSFLRDSKKLAEGLKGSFTPEYKVIWIDDARPKGDIKSTLVHEIQHAIQGIEGFAQGGTPAAFASAKYQAEEWKANFNKFINRYGFEDWSKNIPTEDWMKYGKEYKGQFGGLHRAFIDNAVEDEDVKKTLTKELDYVKAAYDKFYQIAGGMDPAYKFKDANEWYRSLSGEVESRNVQQRMGMTDEQRRNTLAESTEDVAREDQVFLKDGIESGEARFRSVNEPAVDYVLQANDVVEVPRDEVMYTMNNIANQLYKTSGRFMRQLYKYGTLGRVLKGEYAEIDQIKAKNEYDHAKPILEEYLNELVWMKYQATEAAQEVINDVISDVEYAMQYYKDLSLGKDVWRTQSSPRFRISEKGKQIQTEVDKFTSKYNSKEVVVVEVSSMSDKEIEDMFNSPADEVREAMNEGLSGGYNLLTDKIYIFVDNQSLDELEETIFHENMHPSFHGDKMIGAFDEAVKDNTKKMRASLRKRGYREDEIAEEVFVRITTDALLKGDFKNIEKYLPKEYKEDFYNKLKDFGYDTEEEIGRRTVGRRTGSDNQEVRTSRSEEQGASEEVVREGRAGQDVLSGRRDSGRSDNSENGPNGSKRAALEEVRNQAEQIRKLFDQVADMGLEGVLGNESYNVLMRDVYNSLPKDVRSQIKEDAVLHYNGDFVPAMSDYLNIKGKANVWDKIVGAFKEALRRIGVDVPLTGNDVKYLLWRNQKRLNPYSIIDKAADIHKQATLKVGAYADEASSTRFREKRPAIVQRYDETIDSSSFRFQEAFQDSMLSLKVLMETIEAETGKKAKSFENAYTAENRLSSINKIDNEKYLADFFNPLMAEIKSLSDKFGQKTVEDYIYAKSGLERNEVLKQRDADKAYAVSIEELDEKLRKGELTDDQYDALKTNAEIARTEAMAKEDDYAGLRGLLFNSKVYELDMKLERGEIDLSEYNALYDKLEEDAEEVEKGFKEYAEGLVSDFETEAGEDAVNGLWEKINAATNETLRKDYESGMMDKETYEATKNMMKYYVPLRGWSEKTAEEVYDYHHTTAPIQRNQKTAKGRRSQADNPITSIAQMAQNAIVRGNRNKMKQRLFNFVVNRPTSLATFHEGWYVKSNATGDFELEYPRIEEGDTAEDIQRKMDEFEKRMEELSKDKKAFKGKMPFGSPYRIQPKQKNEHLIPVMINGREYGIYVNGNPRAAQAVNGLTNPEASNILSEMYESAKRFYSAGLTSWNPDFLMANAVRDSIHSVTMTYLDKGPLVAAHFLRDIPKSLQVIRAEIFGKGSSDPQMHQYFEEFVNFGGETGYTAIQTLEDYKKEYEKILKNLEGWEKNFQSVKNGFSAIAGWMEQANRMFEDINRFNAYQAARKSGLGIEESVDAAKNITVNFNKKGAMGTTKGIWGSVAGVMSKWILFFNPTVQGITQILRSKKVNPKRFNSLMGVVFGSGLVVPMLNSLVVGMIGGDEEDYWLQNDYNRMNNLLLKNPLGSGYFKIPLPPTFREIYGMGDILYRLLTGRITPERAAVATLRQIQLLTGFLNVIPDDEPDLGKALIGLAPDVLAPLTDVVMNQDFTGRKIAKVSDYNKHDPEYLRVYKGVSPFYVEMSRYINKMGGDDISRAPLYGTFINPAYMEHIVTGYTGGIGKTLSNVAGIVADAVSGEFNENFDMRKIPIASRFYSVSDETTVRSAVTRKYRDYQSRYEKLNHDYKKYKDAVNDGKVQYSVELERMENSGEKAFVEYFKRKQKVLNKKLDRLKKNPDNKDLEKEITDLKAEIALKCYELLK